MVDPSIQTRLSPFLCDNAFNTNLFFVVCKKVVLFSLTSTFYICKLVFHIHVYVQRFTEHIHSFPFSQYILFSNRLTSINSQIQLSISLYFEFTVMSIIYKRGGMKKIPLANQKSSFSLSMNSGVGDPLLSSRFRSCTSSPLSLM